MILQVLFQRDHNQVPTYLNFTSQVKCCDCSRKKLGLVDPSFQSYKDILWNKLTYYSGIINQSQEPQCLT